MRILVAEDDAISRSLLERTLQRAGYDVMAVADGMHALLELGKSDAPAPGAARLDHARQGRCGGLPGDSPAEGTRLIPISSCCPRASRKRTSWRAWNPGPTIIRRNHLTSMS